MRLPPWLAREPPILRRHIQLRMSRAWSSTPTPIPPIVLQELALSPKYRSRQGSLAWLCLPPVEFRTDVESRFILASHTVACMIVFDASLPRIAVRQLALQQGFDGLNCRVPSLFGVVAEIIELIERALIDVFALQGTF